MTISFGCINICLCRIVWALIGIGDWAHIDLCAAAARDFRLYPAGTVGNTVFFEQFFERFEFVMIPTFVNFNFFSE